MDDEAEAMFIWFFHGPYVVVYMIRRVFGRSYEVLCYNHRIIAGDRCRVWGLSFG